MKITIINRAFRLRVMRQYNANKLPNNSIAGALVNSTIIGSICASEVLKIVSKYQPNKMK